MVNGNLIINSKGDTTSTTDGLALILHTLQATLSRYQLDRQIGITHRDQRDTWTIFGYPDEGKLTPEYYESLYRRDGIARRIVDLYPQDTWKDGFVLVDGEARSDTPDNQTSFVKEWVKLVKKHKIWRKLRTVDRLSRMGRFAALVIAENGVTDFSQPITSASRGVNYISVYGEPEVAITGVDRNINSEQYGKPAAYRINRTIEAYSLPTQTVHYSRILHVVEDPLRDEVFSPPALEVVVNRLIDKEKVVGGGSEAYWLNVAQKLAIIADKTLRAGDAALTAMADEIEKFTHGFQQYMRLGGEGTKVQAIPPDMVSPKDAYDVILSEIAAASGIPQRKLRGTEEGRLAGSQDERDWIGKIEARRTQYAGPDIAEPLVQWFIDHGALPPPTSGEFEIQWGNIFELDELQESEIGKNRSEALRDYVGSNGDASQVVEPNEFRKSVFKLEPRDDLEGVRLGGVVDDEPDEGELDDIGVVDEQE